MTEDRVSMRDILSAVNRLEDKIDKRVSNIESDVDDLKANSNRAIGVIGIISTFISITGSYFWTKITKL